MRVHAYAHVQVYSAPELATEGGAFWSSKDKFSTYEPGSMWWAKGNSYNGKADDARRTRSFSRKLFTCQKDCQKDNLHP